jgi:magnesium chelatase subunit I
MNDSSNKEYSKSLMGVPGLEEVVKKFHPKLKGDEKLLMMEYLLHGLAEYSLLSKNNLVAGLRFRDLFTSVFNQGSNEN